MAGPTPTLDLGPSDDAAADRFALVGTVLDSKYGVEELVAEGGFGVVYRGEHLTLHRPIAIKVLKTPPEYSAKARAAFIEKFALEARTIARMSHPAIVQVLDFGVSRMGDGEPAPWMVLEWLDGQTLEEALEARRHRGPDAAPGAQRPSAFVRGRPPAEALALLRPVFDALAYAHDEGVAHRDLKPANVMVVQSRRGATLKLMDFGIAKLMDDGEVAGGGQTRTRSIMNACSPHYAAPEQISGTRTGPWTDVHALALLVTEVLTDEPPYTAPDMTALLAQVLGPARPTPARHRVEVGAWEPLLARALSVRPDERFASAGEFLAALEAALPRATHLSAVTAPMPPGATPLHPATVPSLPPTFVPAGGTTLSSAAFASNVFAPASASPGGAQRARAGRAVAAVAVGAAALAGVVALVAASSLRGAPPARAPSQSPATPIAMSGVALAPAAPAAAPPAQAAVAPSPPRADPPDLPTAAAPASNASPRTRRTRGARTTRATPGGGGVTLSPRRRPINID